MNLAVFLHNQKEYKDSTLPLPLAPLYVLPHQKWYFSSASLTPLRKRRDNTSLFKYLEELQILQQKQEENKPLVFSNCDREILCVHEKNNYFDNKIKHIFDAVFTNFAQATNRKEKIKCECTSYIDEERSKNFMTTVDTLNKCLYSSKKNPKIEVLTQQEQKINWYEFTKNLILQELQIQSHSIPQQSLYLYKLPQTKNKTSHYIFNVLWSDNYVIFNNGNKLQINQNMKSKAVELCEIVSKKLGEFIWAKAQGFIPKVAEDVIDHERFLHDLQAKLKISTFKVWFYKKPENNEIYILNLSHLSFKGVECTLYNDFNIKNQPISQDIPIKQSTFDNNIKLKDITQLNKSLQNKKKAISVSNKSLKAMRNLINPTEIQRMKNLLDLKNFDIAIAKPAILVKQPEQITQIQCSCCRDLLTASQVVNQITANHIQQIRYLRQIKIGKKEHSPYDFVKVCTLCYNAYLKHYKHQSLERRSEKTGLQRDRSAKNSQSFLEKGVTNFQDYKARDSSLKMHKNESNRLLFGKASKERAKSELNHSKEQVETSINEDKNMTKDRSISMRPQHFLPPKQQKQQKLHTTKTTNTQNTIHQRQEFLSDLNNSKFVMPRSQTQEQQPMITTHNSIRFKNQLQNKTHNLINRIISNSFQAKRTEEPYEQSLQQEAINKINTKIIMNAIDQYQKIDRVSFKKLITKNHRMYMIKQPSRERLLQKGDNWEVDWKKSIKSYFQN